MISPRALVSLPTAGTLPLVVAQAVAAIALGLLAASGIAKLVDPTPTTGAMRSAKLPSSDFITYSLGGVEILAALSALSVGGLSAWAGALLYAAFAVFTFAALRGQVPLQSCGCFGREDTPPTALHVGFNLMAALALATLPLLGLDPVPWNLEVAELALFLAFAATGAYASYLLLSSLPRLTAAARR